ncbi:LysM peptidoglycan-binding domain-containing M23 family metallopeptidase [Amphibacillus sediminis]|uniref:LysM peptidoglycan-binding domain-containing M23 family metallopeptidase n=1 Tax=Amphibacillus sediminis TaxID=360185 RepID=UPI0008363973|nr:M23 family metallopeptidase [Amphibacillus sediminis]
MTKANDLQVSLKLVLTSLLLIIGYGLINPLVVHATDDSELATIYHVYLDYEYIGAANNDQVIYDYIDEQVEAKALEHDHFRYGVAQELTLVPERVFHQSGSDEEVVNKLAEKLMIQVEATALELGGNAVGFFASEHDAEQALFEYKTIFVDEDVLNQLAELDSTDQGVEIEDDAVILNVELSEEVRLSEAFADESEILTVEQGVKLLEQGTLEDKIHKVESGDTLSTMASHYDLTLDQLLELNPELSDDTVLQLEQEINVTDYTPFADVIVYQEEQVEEVIKYEKIVEQSDDLYLGESKQKQQGVDGKKAVRYAFTVINGQETNRDILEEDVIKEAVDQIVIEGTKEIPSRGTGDFNWPAVGGYISSGYGQRWGSMHKGIDIARPSNRDILATDNGTVEKVSYESNGYGHYIVINHNNGYKTLYAHLESVAVSTGETVPQGTKIGVMGSTGRSTGVHLHFEVLKNGSNLNPTDVLN